MKVILGFIAALLAIVCLIPYIRDVLRGKTKPHLFTWIVWSIATMTVFVGQWISGGGPGSWTTGITGVLTIFITLLAFKYGTKNVTKLDKVFFILALLALVPWFITKDPLVSVVMITCVDMFAFFPTIRKSYSEPHTETLFTYTLNIFRHSLSIASLARYSIVTVLFPAMLVVMNVVTTLIIRVRRRSL